MIDYKAAYANARLKKLAEQILPKGIELFGFESQAASAVADRNGVVEGKYCARLVAKLTLYFTFDVSDDDMEVNLTKASTEFREFIDRLVEYANKEGSKQ